MGSRALRACFAALAVGAAACLQIGCVDASSCEKALSQLEEARRGGAVRDTQLRAYEWQLATLGQQLREAQLRSDTLQRELYAQVQQLTAAEASLEERLKRSEGERAALLQAATAEASPSAAKGGRPADEVRRLIAAADARNAQVLEALARLERALTTTPRPRPPAEVSTHDVVDPWGFGSRK